MYSSIVFKEGNPFKGKLLKKLKYFLNYMDLDYMDSIDYSVAYFIGDEIVATGSLSSNILVDFAIKEDLRGENLSIKIITALLYKAHEKAIETLFIYTKPSNAKYFYQAGFFEVVKTTDIILLSTNKNLILNFVSSVKEQIENCSSKCIGSIVMKADPFTLGHLYLINYASLHCDLLLLFIVEEGSTFFDYKTRLKLVKQGVKDISNVKIFGTSQLMVSPLTFPTYFYKEKTDKQKVISNINLDLQLFSIIANALNIKKRFIATEPYSKVTNLYNQKMNQFLPDKGVRVIEILRKKHSDFFISATIVRKAFELKQLKEIKNIVPISTYQELCNILAKDLINES